MSHRLALILLLFGTVLFLAEPVRAAAPDQARADHERIVRYWTSDRVDRALPRDLTRPLPATPQGKGGKPGGGGSGGGGASAGAVTGARWTAGGLVKQTTGRVLFTLNGTDYVCSGSVVAESRVDASVVLTAGHCVFDENADVFSTNWMFVPDYETGGTFSCDLTRFGCWTASALVTTTGWRDGDFNEDYAFAILGPGGKTGQALQLDATVGAQPISFEIAQPAMLYSFGYPAARPYNGQSLTYCAGTTAPDTWGGSTDFALNCDMTGGSSGGPWMANFDLATGIGTLTSVNSFKYRGLKDYMFGPFVDANGAAAFTVALSVDSNVLVPPVQ